MKLTRAASPLAIYRVNHKKCDILFLTITLANLNQFLKIAFISFQSWRNSTCDCSKIYHITLLVCAPYFVNLNNNLFHLKRNFFGSFTFIAKENRKSSPIITFTVLPFWHCEIYRVDPCVWGWFSWLYTRSPTASSFSAVCVVRGRPLPDARSVDPVVLNHLRKSSTPHVLHFLFGNSLINRLTRTFLIPRYAVFINIFW